MTNSPSEQKKTKPKHRIIASIRNNFFTGIIVALPIGVTVWIITKIINLVDKNVKPLIPPQLSPDTYLPFPIPGFGIIVSVIALWMLGIVATNFFGSRLLHFGEKLFSRVPFVSNIYKTLKQIVVTMSMQKDKAFKEVCLIEYPMKDIWAIGFITSDLKGAPSEVLPDGHVCVFVPTTPNPTSGFLLFVKRANLKILNMTPEEGAKMIISGGMVSSNEELEKLSTTTK
ncbi:MAG: DUF502 domain-containing protein [Robiginitomaculum sp.]